MLVKQTGLIENPQARRVPASDSTRFWMDLPGSARLYAVTGRGQSLDCPINGNATNSDSARKTATLPDPTYSRSGQRPAHASIHQPIGDTLVVDTG